MNSCITKFIPKENSKFPLTLKHVHLDKIIPYQMGSLIQDEIVKLHIDNKLANRSSKFLSNIYPLLITMEFDSVYTGGKREKNPNWATKRGNSSIPFVQTDRGGQITYHGPGQLVAYFIWDLGWWKNLNSRCFVNLIEKGSLETIQKVKVLNVCTTDNTGVWIKGDTFTFKKISSLGLNVKRNVTSHGLSINLNPNLSFMNDPNFVLCGLDGFEQTSISNELSNKNNNNSQLNIEKLSNVLADTISNRMSVHMDAAMSVDKLILNAEDEITNNLKKITEFIQ